MSNCCSTAPDVAHKAVKLNCRKCLEPCKSVSNATVLQHLSFPINLEIETVIENYFYCANSNCTVSYFSKTGRIYETSQIREQNELQQGWLCYCFDISKEQYQHAIKSETALKIKNFVIAQTKAHQCACETRNPSGQCCLADFKRMDKMNIENN